MTKQFVATVFRQAAPVPTGKTFSSVEGEVFQDHRPSFVEVGKVTGSWEECWTEAKKLTSFPVVEFTEVKSGHA